MKKRMITVEEAIHLLKDGDTIHTFRQGGNMLLGADSSRESIEEIIRSNSDTLQLGGDQCRRMKHGLVLIDDTGALFIETDEKKLNEFDPINPVATT